MNHIVNIIVIVVLLVVAILFAVPNKVNYESETEVEMATSTDETADSEEE
jgi:hypothetical protein